MEAWKESREKVKAGLFCCRDISECKYEARKDCPYRKTDFTCDRLKLMDEAKDTIESLERIVQEQEEMMKSARIALGVDCDNCDRW